MSNLRQKIPNLLRGISQQPDNKKFLGQLRESVNAYPDWPTGLMKRPGEKLISKLVNAQVDSSTTKSKWFSIVRDGNEKYVGQFDATNRLFRIWSALTGEPITVDMGPYSQFRVGLTCNIANLETARLNYVAAKEATQSALAALQVAESTLAKAIADESSTTDTYLEVDTTYSVSFEQSVISGVLYNESTGDYIVKYQGNFVPNTPTTSLPSGYALGADRSADYEIISSNGFKLYEVIVTTAAAVVKPIFVGYTVGTSLTVTSVTQGSIYIGMYITTPGMLSGTKVTAGAGSSWTLNSPTVFANGTVFTGYSVARTNAEDAYTTAKSTYDAAVITEANLLSTWNAELSNCTDNNVNTANYLTDGDTTNPVNPDDLEILTLTDYTFILNKTKKVKALEQTFVGSIASTTLTVTTCDSFNEVVPGMTITYAVSGTSYTATIFRQLTSTAPGGAVGSTGTYQLNGSPTAAPANTTFTAPLISPTYPTEGNNSAPYLGFVVISNVGNLVRYYVTLTVNGTAYTYNYETPASTVRVDTQLIVTNLVTNINAGSGTHGVVASAVGPGILLKSSNNFAIETSGGPSSGGIYAFSDSIADITKLPPQCANGYVVKVANTQNTNEDDLYVKFNTIKGTSTGLGIWQETVKPGIKIALDPKTMPHQLVRKEDGTFIFGPVSNSLAYYSSTSQIVNADNFWAEREVGDDTTNPLPSFVDRTISGIFFYRDRLGFLSDDNVILSRAGNYFTFFGKSAGTVADNDPIDQNVASIEPTVINYVLPVSVGLVLFGQRQQFILTTDADVLSPKAAKINNLSNYECDTTLKAQSLGSTVAFISKSNLYTRVYEMIGITVDAPPVIDETSRIVPQLMPATLDNYIISPNLSLASFGTTDSNILYQYRYLVQAGDGGGQQRVLSSWYKWELTNQLKHQFFDLNNLYVVGKSGSDILLTVIDLAGTKTDGEIMLASGRTVNTNLDMWDLNPHRTYDSTTLKTTVTTKFVPNAATLSPSASKRLCLVCLDEYIGDAQTEQTKGKVIYPTTTDFTSSTQFTIDGDYRGKTLILGYTYQMLVELPKLYYTKEESGQAVSDTEVETILHRMRVGLTMSGPLDYQVKITGVNNWNNNNNVTYANQYLLDTVNVVESAEQVIPVYQRNKNVQLIFNSYSPLPLTIDWLTWEGKVNSRSYRSA